MTTKQKRYAAWQLAMAFIYTAGLLVGMFLDKPNLIMVSGFLLVTVTVARLIKAVKDLKQ